MTRPTNRAQHISCIVLSLLFGILFCCLLLLVPARLLCSAKGFTVLLQQDTVTGAAYTYCVEQTQTLFQNAGLNPQDVASLVPKQAEIRNDFESLSCVLFGKEAPYAEKNAEWFSARVQTLFFSLGYEDEEGLSSAAALYGGKLSSLYNACVRRSFYDMLTPYLLLVQRLLLTALVFCAAVVLVLLVLLLVLPRRGFGAAYYLRISAAVCFFFFGILSVAALVLTRSGALNSLLPTEQAVVLLLLRYGAIAAAAAAGTAVLLFCLLLLPLKKSKERLCV